MYCIAPLLIREEFENNALELQRKSYLSSKEFFELSQKIFTSVALHPHEAFRDYFNEAERILSGHHKDVPYVALALATGARFWTNEKFPRNVPTISTEELRKMLC